VSSHPTTDNGPWIAGSASTSTHYHPMRNCHLLEGSTNEIRQATPGLIEFHDFTECPDCKQTIQISEINVPPVEPDDELTRMTLRFPNAHVGFVEEIVDAGLYPNKSEVYRTALSDFVDRFELPPTLSDPATVEASVDAEMSTVATDGCGVVGDRDAETVTISKDRVDDVLERLDRAIEQNEIVISKSNGLAAAKTDRELRAARRELGDCISGGGIDE